jgi:anti-sigma B factor antagonist
VLTTLNTFVQDDVLVVSTVGHLDSIGDVEIEGKRELGPNALKNLIKEQVGNGLKNFVLDLTACKYIDSMGIGALVVVYTTIANANGRASMALKQGRVYDLLRITKLQTLFHIYDTVEDALKYLGKASPA